MSSHSSLHQSIAAVAHAPGHFLHNAKANGLMKRNSIFSRPASRNSSIDLDTSILDLSRSTHCASSPPEPTPRPSTSTASLMERSNTDPSLGKRHSLFRSRRRSNRKNVRAEDAEGAEIAPKDFRTDEEYRSHLRKQSISPPFNFQHLSHTRRKHVPGLGTVDESGSFRVPANPQPIEPVKSRPTTPCLPSSGPGPQHSSSRSVDVSHGRQTAPSTVVRPRAASCQTRNGNEPISQVVGLSMSNPNIPATSAAIPPITAQVQHCSPSEIKYRAKQPLPALPQRATSQGHPKRMTQDSQLSCSTTSSSDSYRSSTHMRTAGPWTCLDEHGSTVEPFEASWEEDVDFCYEREAESTCDFNWDENEQIDAGFRLSKYLQPIEGSRNSALFASPIINASPVQPRRSSIVGHRGFLQARNNSVSHTTAEDRASAQESQDQLVSITEESKPIFGPEIMHNDTSLENSSDSASTRTGTSFYDDSDAHPMPSSGDNGHSSVASLSSVPELMPSSYSTSSNDATASTEHVAPLPSRQSFSSCDVMRKPSTLSNRAILQAGRVVQRGRVSSNASMGGRISRMPSKQFQRPAADGEEATTWI